VQSCCDQCRENWSRDGDCENCGAKGEQIFKGENADTQFCDWLFQPANQGKTVIMHNFRGYGNKPYFQLFTKLLINCYLIKDGQFIMKYLHSKGIRPDKIVPRGLSLLAVEVGGIRLIGMELLIVCSV